MQLCAYWEVTSTFLHRILHFEITVCTRDADENIPLDGSVIVTQFGTDQPVGGTTSSNGCVDLSLNVPSSTSTDEFPSVESGFGVRAPFPNPAIHQVTLPLITSLSQTVEIELFDITGRSLFPPLTSTLPSGDHQISVFLGDLTPGLYLYTIHGEHGYASGTFVKVGTGSEASPRILMNTFSEGDSQKLPGIRSAIASSAMFTVDIEAARQGYKASSSQEEVADGQQVTLMLEKLDPGVPSAPLLLQPATGATDVAPQNVNLAWIGDELSTSYAVQVSRDMDFVQVDLQQEEWFSESFAIANLDPATTYYWRVRATGAEGTSDWSLTSQFSTSNSSGSGAPPVPTIIIPVNGATAVEPGAVTFSWESIAEAATYDFQLSTSATFQTVIDQQVDLVDASVVSNGLLPNTTYYWHVRSANEAGRSDWSPVASFTTAEEGSGSRPLPPELVTPADGATGVFPGIVLFTWNGVNDAESYDAQLSTSSDFSDGVEEKSGETGTSVSFEATLANTAYFWRARSRNQVGVSDWSEVYRFTTGSPATANEMIPLDVMQAGDTYYGLPGGLVDNGVPTVTPSNGKIIIIAISMSNGYQEFKQFIELYENHPDKNPDVEFENCAVGGSALERWLEGEDLWERCKQGIDDLSAVKVVWAKNANQFTDHGRTLPDPQADYYDLIDHIGGLSQRIGDEFPSVQAVFHSSRIWGGYVTENKQAGRGEPISYEGGFATNAVIEKYQRGELPGAPWIGWGPYLWAHGDQIANGSGITWTLGDFQDGGVNQHPSEAGATKVADALHQFFMQFDWYRR